MAEKLGPGVIVRFAADDRALLEAIAAHERLTMSDIIRRAIRSYARELGVKQPKPTKK